MAPLTIHLPLLYIQLGIPVSGGRADIKICCGKGWAQSAGVTQRDRHLLWRKRRGDVSGWDPSSELLQDFVFFFPPIDWVSLFKPTMNSAIAERHIHFTVPGVTFESQCFESYRC